jgi:protein PhnA
VNQIGWSLIIWFRCAGHNESPIAILPVKMLTSVKIPARATRQLTRTLCLIALPSLVSSFGLMTVPKTLASQTTLPGLAFRKTSVYRTPGTERSTRLFSSLPEPGPCPECSDENSYWDGSTLFICTACDHEWPVEGTADAPASASDGDDVTRDSNGVILEQGDSCVLIKDLAKGKLKKGLKVKIRLGDYGGGHDCEATLAGVGTYALKSEFLKKV